MFDLIKQVIENKSYKLEDMLYKINKMYLESYLTEEEKTELDNLARENANPVNSYASVQKQIDNIYIKISNLDNRVSLLENTGESNEEEEYKEFVQPTGSHDAYNEGDRVVYKGKNYICKMNSCVWAPDVYPEAWREIVDE